MHAYFTSAYYTSQSWFFHRIFQAATKAAMKGRPSVCNSTKPTTIRMRAFWMIATINTCKEQNLGVQLTLNGHLQGSALSLKLEFWGTLIPLELQKKPSNHSASAPHQDQRQRDPALVGKWVRQSNYNSSGFGQGSMATETSLVLLADGQVADGGSRTVVGGSSWSGSSSKQGGSILPGLIWYTQNRQLYLQITEHGQTQVQLLGSYYVENQNMLVTGTDGTKVLYYKQIE
jgi:hypothetical protein